MDFSSKCLTRGKTPHIITNNEGKSLYDKKGEKIMNYKTIDPPKTTAFADSISAKVEQSDINPLLKFEIIVAIDGLKQVIHLQNRTAFCLEKHLKCENCRLKGRCFNAEYQLPVGCTSDYINAVQSGKFDDLMKEFDLAHEKCEKRINEIRGKKQCK